MNAPTIRTARAVLRSLILRVPFLVGLVFLVLSATSQVAHAQAHRHEHGDGDAHHHGIHFTHPMVAESISPDVKLRVNYVWQNLQRRNDSEMELEGEYAFHRTFSVEGGVHYHPTTGEFGRTHVILKFASYAFEEQGVLLGYGVEFGLPTGTATHSHDVHDHAEHEHEHSHAEPESNLYEITPFLNAGLMSGGWEIVGWTLFSIPTNHTVQESVGTEFRYNASVLYHATSRIEPLVEVYGQTGLSGLRAGRAVLNVAPGLRITPLASRNLALGAAVGVPITDHHDFDTHLLVSAFYHF